MIIEDIQCDGNVVPRDLEGTLQLFLPIFQAYLVWELLQMSFQFYF